MHIFHGLHNFAASWLDVLRVQAHIFLAQLHHPTLKIQRPGVWRFDTHLAIKLGQDVVIGPYTEIVVYSRTRNSRVAGGLVCGDRVFIGAGSNIRAAGGTISIGAHTMIGQNVSIVAANHTVSSGNIYRDLEWNQEKTGVTIGSNCWIGAHSVLVPGVVIGSNSVIGAGSVVTKNVPDNEIWLGVPARFQAKITCPT